MNERKDTRIFIRMTTSEKETWEEYAKKVGYKNLSGFVRDSINGIISMGSKPKVQVLITDIPK